MKIKLEDLDIGDVVRIKGATPDAGKEFEVISIVNDQHNLDDVYVISGDTDIEYDWQLGDNDEIIEVLFNNNAEKRLFELFPEYAL